MAFSCRRPRNLITGDGRTTYGLRDLVPRSATVMRGSPLYALPSSARKVFHLGVAGCQLFSLNYESLAVPTKIHTVTGQQLHLIRLPLDRRATFGHDKHFSGCGEHSYAVDLTRHDAVGR